MTKKGIIYRPPLLHGCFDIKNVFYRGKIANYRLLETMTDRMTADQHAQIYNENKPKKLSPYPMSFPLQFALIHAAYRNRNGNKMHIERFRDFFMTKLLEYPTTLSSIIKTPEGKEKIIHNYGTFDHYSKEGHFFGRDVSVKGVSDKRFLRNILEEEDIRQINNVFRWITEGMTGYIWRSPENIATGRRWVLGLDKEDDKLAINCEADPAIARPAFLVYKID